MKTHSIFSDKTNYVILFFLPATLGYLWEVLLYLVYYRMFCNRGFTYGPWLTVYGLGGLLFYFLFHKLSRRRFLCFILCGLTGSALELLIGIFISAFLDFRYWDYSHWPLNFNGYICLFSGIFFGLFGMLWVCFFCPKLLLLWQSRLHEKKRSIFSLLLYTLFFMDFFFSLFYPNQGIGITCLQYLF